MPCNVSLGTDPAACLPTLNPPLIWLLALLTACIVPMEQGCSFVALLEEVMVTGESNQTSSHCYPLALDKLVKISQSWSLVI
jgi:hypothetical protein